MADLSKLSDADLVALNEKRMQDISDEGLTILSDMRAKNAGQGKSLAAGIAGFNTGVENRGRGFAQAGLSALDAVLPGDNFQQTQQNLTAGVERANQELEQAYPANKTARSVGQFIGDIGALAPAAAAGPAGVTGAAIGGAVEGLTRPSVQDETLGERGIQAGISGAASAVAGKVLEKGGKFVLQKGEKLGKILGFPQRELPDIFVNLKDYGINANVANEELSKMIGKENTRQLHRIGTLYATAEKKGVNAYTDSQAVADLADNLKSRIMNETSSDGKVALDAYARKLMAALNKPEGARVLDIHTIRRDATRDSVNLASGGKHVAAMVRDELDNLLANTPVHGDAAAVGYWNKAIATNRAYNQKFKDVQTAKAVVDILNVGSTDEISNKLFNAGAGASDKSAAMYNQIIKAVRPSQREEAGRLVRRASVNKMLVDSVVNGKTVEGGLESGKIIQSINILTERRGKYWDKFTPSEKSQLITLRKQLMDDEAGDPVTKVARFMISSLRGVKNVELPSTMRAKKTYTLDDIIYLSKIKQPGKFAPVSGGLTGAAISKNISYE